MLHGRVGDKMQGLGSARVVVIGVLVLVGSQVFFGQWTKDGTTPEVRQTIIILSSSNCTEYGITLREGDRIGLSMTSPVIKAIPLNPIIGYYAVIAIGLIWRMLKKLQELEAKAEFERTSVQRF